MVFIPVDENLASFHNSKLLDLSQNDVDTTKTKEMTRICFNIINAAVFQSNKHLNYKRNLQKLTVSTVNPKYTRVWRNVQLVSYLTVSDY